MPYYAQLISIYNLSNTKLKYKLESDNYPCIATKSFRN